MKDLEFKAEDEGNNFSYQKFSDWSDEGWKLITVNKEVSNQQSLMKKLIDFKQFKIWNIKQCHLIGPSGNHYNISGNRKYRVADELDEMVSEFDGAFSDEYEVASNILEEIKGLNKNDKRYFMHKYLDNYFK